MDDRRPGRREASLELLDALEERAAFPGARRIGVTGAPGTGKSTLLDALVRALRGRDQTVGIIAVDPSSQQTGGALLGDRIRVRSGSGDDGVFLRSMAARDRLGGLADATWASVTILAALFDFVFVETVGIGQSESDVAHQTDTLLFVAQPGAGDVLQFMKAGVMELPHVFAVNKSDLGAAASRTAADLSAGLALSSAAEWEPPVVSVSARDGEGIDLLLDALERHRECLERSGGLEERRRHSRVEHVRSTLRERYGSFGLEALGGLAAVAERVEKARRSASALVLELSREIEGRLRSAP